MKIDTMTLFVFVQIFTLLSNGVNNHLHNLTMKLAINTYYLTLNIKIGKCPVWQNFPDIILSTSYWMWNRCIHCIMLVTLGIPHSQMYAPPDLYFLPRLRIPLWKFPWHQVGLFFCIHFVRLFCIGEIGNSIYMYSYQYMYNIPFPSFFLA